MGGAGVVDDDHLRPGQPHGVADLADARSTQLDDCRAVLRGNLQQRQRCAQVIVQVASGRVHQPTGTQDAGQHLLDRGLAAGAGDGHHRLVERGAVQRTQLTQRDAAIRDHQLRQVDIGNLVLDQRRHGTLGLHIGQVIVAIETRPRQATNSCPAPTLRLSMLTPVKLASAPTWRAPSAAVSWLSVMGLSMWSLPGCKCLFGFDQIGESWRSPLISW